MYVCGYKPVCGGPWVICWDWFSSPITPVPGIELGSAGSVVGAILLGQYLKDFIFSCMCARVCVCVTVHVHTRVQCQLGDMCTGMQTVLIGTRRGHQTPWSFNSRCLWAAHSGRVLGTKCKFSERALNDWDIYPFLNLKTCIYLIVCLFRVCGGPCGSQRTTCRNWFFPSTM